MHLPISEEYDKVGTQRYPPPLLHRTKHWTCARLRYIYDMAEPQRNVRIRRLHEQVEETDLEGTTPSERISMMWQLALDAWAVEGDE